MGEDGAGLSEGQQQRLALARVLLLDTPVLILDEPTAALDTESEAQLRRALATVCAGRTTLIIAHRLSTIRLADEILVLQEGVVAEQGTHSELLHAEGVYARLCRAGTGHTHAPEGIPADEPPSHILSAGSSCSFSSIPGEIR